MRAWLRLGIHTVNILAGQPVSNSSTIIIITYYAICNGITPESLLTLTGPEPKSWSKCILSCRCCHTRLLFQMSQVIDEAREFRGIKHLNQSVLGID